MGPRDPFGLRSLRAERLVLAGLMRAPDRCARDVARVGLTADHFGHHATGLCFRALAAAADPGPPALYEALAATPGALADLGDDPAGWIARTFRMDPTGAYCGPAAAWVRWLAARRAAVHAARTLVRDALDAGLDCADPRLVALGCWGPADPGRVADALAFGGGRMGYDDFEPPAERVAALEDAVAAAEERLARLEWAVAQLELKLEPEASRVAE